MNERNLSPAKAEIALCAYLIWENEGRPGGCDWAHWFEAEEQLTATRLSEGHLLERADLEFEMAS